MSTIALTMNIRIVTSLTIAMLPIKTATTLFPIQIIYKPVTAFIVERTSPVVVRNLAVCVLMAAALATF